MHSFLLSARLSLPSPVRRSEGPGKRVTKCRWVWTLEKRATLAIPVRIFSTREPSVIERTTTEKRQFAGTSGGGEPLRK